MATFGSASNALALTSLLPRTSIDGSLQDFFGCTVANCSQGIRFLNSGATSVFSVSSGIAGVNFEAPFDANNWSLTAVPEPASWAMLIAGFGLVGATMRRRRLVAA